MADMMKSLGLLPLALAATSCIPSVPYDQQRPPYRNGEAYYPYGPGPRMNQEQGPGPDSESGRYEQIPNGNEPPPVQPRNSPEPQGDNDSEPAPAAPKPRQEYPTAERTEQPGRVLSPYKPYNVIDVEGFKSGQLAKDPSNGKIFRVP